MFELSFLICNPNPCLLSSQSSRRTCNVCFTTSFQLYARTLMSTHSHSHSSLPLPLPPASASSRFPPMGTHFKLRARHLGVRAPLISADNKGKQKPMPPAYNVGVLHLATICPVCPGILFGGKRCNSSAVAASAAHASPEHISSRGTQLSDAYKSCLSQRKNTGKLEKCRKS